MVRAPVRPAAQVAHERREHLAVRGGLEREPPENRAARERAETGGAQREFARSRRLRRDVLRLHGPSHRGTRTPHTESPAAVSSATAYARIHVRLHGIALDIDVEEHAPFASSRSTVRTTGNTPPFVRLRNDLRGKVEEEVRADAQRGASPEPVQNQNAFRRIRRARVSESRVLGDRPRVPEIEAHRAGDAFRLSQSRARRGIERGGKRKRLRRRDVVPKEIAPKRRRLRARVRGATQRLRPGVALAAPASRRGEHEPPPVEHEVEFSSTAGVPARRARNDARVRQRRREVNRQRRRAPSGGHRRRRRAFRAFHLLHISRVTRTLVERLLKRNRLLRQQNQLPGDAERQTRGPLSTFRVRERDPAYSAHQRARPERPRVEARDVRVGGDLGGFILGGSVAPGETREDHA